MSSKWENRCESFERVPGSSGPWMMVCSLPFPLGGGPCMWIASLFFYFHMVWIWFNSASSSSMRLKSIIGYLTALQAMRPLLNSSVIPRRWEGERPTNLSPLLWWRQLSAARWASVSSAWKEAPGGGTIAWRDTLDREEDSGPWGERHPWANPLPSTATHPALQHGTEESALDSASTKTWVWALSSVPASVSSSVKRSWWYIPSLLQRVPGGSKKGRQWFCCHSGVRACDRSSFFLESKLFMIHGRLPLSRWYPHGDKLHTIHAKWVLDFHFPLVFLNTSLVFKLSLNTWCLS